MVVDNAAGCQVAGGTMADMPSFIAVYLEMVGENEYKVLSYRNAAEALRTAGVDLSQEFADRGKEALTSISGIGEGIGRVLEEYLQGGHSSLLEELKAQATPRQLFADLPGVGSELADRIVAELGVTTLPELEQAAHDGRLSEVEGFGTERVEGIKQVLASRLSRRSRRSTSGTSEKPSEPPVATLLEVDRIYRQKAEAGELRRIARKRINPAGEAWLPILETNRDGWQFTAGRNRHPGKA